MINSQFGLVQIVKIQQRNQLMSEQVPSKKWVDYTDQESSEDHQQQTHTQDTSINHNIPATEKPKESKKTYKPTKMEIDDELDKLDQLDDDRIDEVWLLMTSQDAQYLEKEINYLKSKAKKGGNIVSVYPSKLPDAYDVRVYIKIAYDYISKGYDNTDLMKVTVAQRNFMRKGETKGRNKRQNDYKEGDKKKYVDKETGLEPPPKTKKVDSTNLENDRKYSKQEAEKKGEELGNFRSKPYKKQTEESKPTLESKVTEVMKEEEKPKEEVKQEIKKEVEEVKREAKQEVKAQPKQQAKEEPAKESKKGKVQKKKSKGGNNKYKSQNRFQGIEDLD